MYVSVVMSQSSVCSANVDAVTNAAHGSYASSFTENLRQLITTIIQWVAAIDTMLAYGGGARVVALGAPMAASILGDVADLPFHLESARRNMRNMSTTTVEMATRGGITIGIDGIAAQKVNPSYTSYTT